MTTIWKKEIAMRIHAFTTGAVKITHNWMVGRQVAQAG